MPLLAWERVDPNYQIKTRNRSRNEYTKLPNTSHGMEKNKPRNEKSRPSPTKDYFGEPLQSTSESIEGQKERKRPPSSQSPTQVKQLLQPPLPEGDEGTLPRENIETISDFFSSEFKAGLSDTEMLEKYVPLDKQDDTIKELLTSNEQLDSERRTLSVLAEVALKATDHLNRPGLGVFDGDSREQVFTFGHGIAPSTFTFDEHGLINPSHLESPHARAQLVQSNVLFIMQMYRRLNWSITGYTIPKFLTFIATLLPQIHFLAETAIGDSLTAQSQGAATAWFLLMSALRIAMEPPPRVDYQFRLFGEHCTHVTTHLWSEADFETLSRIDNMMRTVLYRRIEAVEEVFDDGGVHAKYWECNIGWVREAKQHLDDVAIVLSQDGMMEEACCLRATREGIWRVLQHVQRLRLL